MTSERTWVWEWNLNRGSALIPNGTLRNIVKTLLLQFHYLKKLVGIMFSFGRELYSENHVT